MGSQHAAKWLAWPKILASIVVGLASSAAIGDIAPSHMVRAGGVRYFVGDDGVHGRELWRTNGTAAGTEMVADINPGPASSDPQHLVALQGVLYFAADDGVTGVELWRSDGTPAGTTQVSDINFGAGGSSPRELTRSRGQLYFTAFNPADGNELWQSDGSATGTVRVSDIRPGTGGSNPQVFAAAGRFVYFTADDGATGRELWRSDGTAAGTALVSDFTPGTDSTFHPFSEVPTFAAIGRTLYFPAGDELWKTTGKAGPVRVGGGAFTPRFLTASGGAVYFTAHAGDPQARAVWKSDGTETGTLRVSQLFPAIPPPEGGHNPTGLMVVDGVSYFTADDGLTGYELWKADGTAQAAVQLRDIWPGPVGSYGFAQLEMNGFVYFTADDGFIGRELWKTDGTIEGTVLVSDIHPTGSSQPSHLSRVGNRFLFRADDGATGIELWRSNGTDAGTRLLLDLNPAAP